MLKRLPDEITGGDWFCADTETEILTSGGWRRYDQVSAGDLVASLNVHDGIARWTPVLRMNVFTVADEKMLRIEGKGLSAMVTAGHRWPVQQRHGTAPERRQDWQVRTSDQLTLESSAARSAPFAHPKRSIYADAFVEIVGWAWTEGHYRENGGIHLSQSPSVNPGKCEQIERALTELYGPPTGTAGRRRGQPFWNVSDYEGTRYWRLNTAAAAPILAAAPDRVLSPEWLLSLTSRQLDLLVETSMLADGTSRTRDGARDSSLSQNRQDRAEGFQFAAILAGRGTAIHRWEMLHKGAVYPMWRVSLLERVTAKPLRQAVAEWTTYTGTVWCPTVAYGTWLCRRNGLVHWTGNCGAGGSSQGMEAAGVKVVSAANHWEPALRTHEENFPDALHKKGDIRDLDLYECPPVTVFWSSPECPYWSQGRGEKQTYANQASFFDSDDDKPESEGAAERSRALMWNVVTYLEAMQTRGYLVLAGVVENVPDVVKWIHFGDWRRAFEKLGYKTKVIALNSMHAQSRVTPRAPQSRTRFYMAYWHKTLGRDPNWDKWLRPPAWCPSCEETVSGLQVWRNPNGRRMGLYGQSYDYRCPRVSCRGQVVYPEVLPAAAVIDWSDLGIRLGDRKRRKFKTDTGETVWSPLAPKTMARIEAGYRRYARPFVFSNSGHTFERRPGVRTWPADGPLPVQTTGQHHGLACPPMITPAGGTWNDDARPVTDPMRTRTTRECEGLAVPPFMVEMRSGMDARPVTDPVTSMTTHSHHGLACPPYLVPMRSGRLRSIPVTDPMATVVASGSGQYLTIPDTAVIMRNNDGGAEMSTPAAEPLRTLTAKAAQSLVDWRALLLPYYSNGTARPVEDPVGTLSTKDRYALTAGTAIPEYVPDDVLFRMLKIAEIQAAMAFFETYRVLGDCNADIVRQLGNAVTPPASEVLVSALVEAITGEDFD
jgi:DNA (cytosine-5)-methyltransferase 1